MTQDSSATLGKSTQEEKRGNSDHLMTGKRKAKRQEHLLNIFARFAEMRGDILMRVLRFITLRK
jgi:hypothetical protein